MLRDARRFGVTQQVMAEIARATKAAANTRIEWSTGTGNAAAHELYDGQVADGGGKVHCLLEGGALEQLAAPRPSGD